MGKFGHRIDYQREQRDEDWCPADWQGEGKAGRGCIVAESLGAEPDSLNLNTKGNALGLLLRWEDARAVYEASVKAADKEFASIPRSNEALALFELGQLAESEKRTKVLMRKDPVFVDAKALLATLRYEQGDRAGAATVIGDLCRGDNGDVWCEQYSNVDIVIGRWTPKAVDAYRRLLAEPSIQRELKNTQQTFPTR